MKRTSIWLVASVFSVVLAAGQIVPGRYIVELEGDPAIVSAVRVKRAERAAAMAGRRAAIRAQHRRVRALIEDGDARVTDTLENVSNALVVRGTEEDMEKLKSLPGVKRVHKVRIYQLAMDHAVNVVHASDAWAAIGGSQFAGAGVRIGIIDTGIDNTHPAFQDDSLRIPDGFPQVTKSEDRVYTNNKIIVARNYDRSRNSTARDTQGHGTAVAMVAAGVANSGPYGVITGIAPKAYLGSYKVFPDGQSGAPDDQILKALDDAVGDNMDVINLSLGSLLAERPETDALVTAVERATAAGIVVVIASGNEGPDPATVGSPGTAPDAITVGNSANDRTFAANASVDSVGSLIAIPGALSSTAPAVSGSLLDVATLDSNGLACDALPAGSLTGKVAFILRGTCVFEDKLRNAQAAGATAALLYTDAARPQPIGMSVTSVKLPAMMVSYSDGVKIKNALKGTPDLHVSLSFAVTAMPVSEWVLSGSSSRGPFMSFIKPEIVAVGTDVSTAWPVRSGSYRVINGTSFSSPMVAGAAALVKAARPGMRGQQYKSLLVNSATTFTDGTFPASIMQTGAGLLNVAAALKAPLTSDPVTLSYGVGNGTLDTWQNLAFTNVSGTNDTFKIEVVPVNGTVAPRPVENSFTLNAGGTAWIPMIIQVSNLGPGEYQGYVNVTSTATGVSIHVPYWYGVGSNKAVRITDLMPYDSAVTAGTKQYIIVRATDASGIPVMTEPVVTVTAGDEAKVLAVENVDDDVPGAYIITVRLSPGVMKNTFHIVVGDVSTDISIDTK